MSAGSLPLDVEVPQDELPTLGERRERRRRGALLEAHLGRVDELDGAIELGLVVSRPDALLPPGAVDVEPADRRQQVGPEELIWALAGLEERQHTGERLGDQVVGVRSRDELRGEPGRGIAVALEQLAVRVGVTVADGIDELRVTGLVRGSR